MNLRLGTFLSRSGVTARRKTKEYLQKNICLVNGVRVMNPAEPVDPESDEVSINDRLLKLETFEYWMLNKPLGVMSTVSDPHTKNTVLKYVRTKNRVYPVGRLDNDTTGLLLLTNDGDLANVLMHPRYQVPKTYELEIGGSVSESCLKQIREGVMLDDGLTSPAIIKTKTVFDAKTVLVIDLFEGKKREIRRMCQALGLRLLRLKRIGFGPLVLGDLSVGHVRPLNADEVVKLHDLTTKRM